MSGKGIIYAEKPQQCDLCGLIAELRPYGPNDEVICYDCAQTFPREQIETKMKAYLGL